MKPPYKEPVFLFTSCSLRTAAWAGWYSALGDIENTQKSVHQAHGDWAKEIGRSSGRRYRFLSPFDYAMYDKITADKLICLTNKYLLDIKREIRKAKST